MARSAEHISLSELQALVKETLERAMPLTYWITAEVSELKVNYSGHCYMQLAEKDPKREQPRAAAAAVAWRSSWGSIDAHFRSVTGSGISAGMKILLRVSISYHELYGLSLVVSDIDPSYTLGDIERERQMTIVRLEQEGVFGMNRSLEMPPLLQRIAIVSSRNAAGYQDFMRELEASPYHFETELFDAFMQGSGAEDSIIAALDAIADRADDFDAVIIIRGGGSQSDLSCFNNYRLCAHVAQFPLPAITGIGHDKDRSVADMVAALEFKTPTAVAAFLVGKMEEEEELLGMAKTRISQIATTMIETNRQLVTSMGISVSHTTAIMTSAIERRLSGAQATLAMRKEGLLVKHGAAIQMYSALLHERWVRAAGAQLSRIRTLAGRIETRDPQRILALGFAIVRIDGKVIKDSTEVSSEATLDITLAKGRVKAKIEKQQ